MAQKPANRKFAIVGLGAINVTKSKDLLSWSTRLLQAEAARLAIEDAGLKREDIDGAIYSKVEFSSGSAGNWMDAFPRVLGLPVNFYFNVARGGATACYAITCALSFLERRIANYVIIGYAENSWSRAHLKQRSHSVNERAGNWSRLVGDVAAASSHSFFACRHMYEYGTTSRQLGAVAVAERAWACKNPAAQMYGRPITIEDHQNSPILIWPYHILDFSLQSDGGTAIIVTTAERARMCKKKPVYIMGIGFGEQIRKFWWEKSNYTQLDVQPAKEAAFRQAKITLQDIDAAQLYDCFTSEVVFQLEDYGWCKKGEGGAFVEAGHIGPGGSIPVNTGGGLLSSHHFNDMTGVSEAIVQLRGEGGQRQVKDAEVCLVTGHGGELMKPGMSSTHASLILGR